MQQSFQVGTPKWGTALGGMTNYVTTGYVPTMYAGYVEGVQELNDMRAKQPFAYGLANSAKV